ncbi:MAG TPA: cytochrome C biogenesis protein ResB [Desulfuromonadales bacterium]|nr:cytochrome C biogenesis protein ResB [Desulfuromonadales bacterium]
MKLWRILVSLELCLGVLALVCTFMAAGSFRLSGEYAAAINSMPLFMWLRETPLSISWWLWIVLALLAVLALNTVLCSSETLWSRWGRGGWSALLAPQFMHAGFLLIVLAHLLSATGSSFNAVTVGEMTLAALPDGSRFGVASISVATSPQGLPLGFSSELVPDVTRPAERVVISPNHPWFHQGYGVYIKQAEAYPYKRALLEIHREPGAAVALAGALLFTVGNVMLVMIRSKQRETEVL